MVREITHYTYDEDNETLTCSQCGMRLTYEETYIPKNFCPNCGRKVAKINTYRSSAIRKIETEVR